MQDRVLLRQSLPEKVGVFRPSQLRSPALIPTLNPLTLAGTGKMAPRALPGIGQTIYRQQLGAQVYALQARASLSRCRCCCIELCMP